MKDEESVFGRTERTEHLGSCFGTGKYLAAESRKLSMAVPSSAPPLADASTLSAAGDPSRRQSQFTSMAMNRRASAADRARDAAVSMARQHRWAMVCTQYARRCAARPDPPRVVDSRRRAPSAFALRSHRRCGSSRCHLSHSSLMDTWLFVAAGWTLGCSSQQD
eukprot:5736644-Prymnesium_polylepis.1